MVLQIDPKLISLLDDESLKKLMNRLLLGEAYRAGADVSLVIINAESRASDQGQDGFTPAPKKASGWLGETQTCWQFKSGKEGEPGNLSHELSKKYPQETLKAGGRFVIIASGSVNGEKGRAARLDKLRKEANAQGLPSDKIDVYTSEQLATWVNEHPSIVCEVVGVPHGVLSLPMWAANSRHAHEFVLTDAARKIFPLIHQTLSVKNDPILHVHLYGHTGIGKTRFAIEACRTAGWLQEVVYIPQSQESLAHDLVVFAAENRAVQMVLVVENALAAHLHSLNEVLGLADGRVRLLSIGSEPIDIPQGSIRSIKAPTLDRDNFTILVKQLFPNIGREHLKYIVQESDGCIKWAQTLGETIKEDPLLLQKGPLHLRNQLVNRMVGGNQDIAPLMALAVMESTGWRGSSAEEGRVLIEHLGLNWGEAQAKIHWFNENYSVAPLAGNYRFISPTPLALFLAENAWEAWPDLLSELYHKLPTEAAKDKFRSRLKTVSGRCQEAREYCKRELGKLSSFADLNSLQDVRRWAFLAGAAPLMAAQKVRLILGKTSLDDRIGISSEVRVELVSMLTAMAKSRSAFDDSTFALATLAEVENECLENNATNEFLMSFSPFLGATAKPYRERIPVLDTLVSRGNKYRNLAIRALGQVMARSGMRIDVDLGTSILRELEWEPKDSEYLDTLLISLERLIGIARNGLKGSEKELIDAAKLGVWLFLNEQIYNRYLEFVEVLFTLAPNECEALELEILDMLDIERLKEPTNCSLSKIQDQVKRLSNPGPEARLRVLMQRRDLDQCSLSEEMDQWALQLIGNPEPLWSIWEWLTSGSAHHAEAFGRALGKFDETGLFFQNLLGKPLGQDLGIIVGYFQGYAEVVGQDALEVVIDEFEEQCHGYERLILDLTCSVSNGDRAGCRAIRLIRKIKIPIHYLQKISHARWVKALSEPTFLELTCEIRKCSGAASSAMLMIQKWICEHPEKWVLIEDIAIDIASDCTVIQSGNGTVEFNWYKLALRLIPKYARAIFKAILEAQACCGDNLWSATRKLPSEILLRCVQLDSIGCWEELINKLIDPSLALSFRFHFPQGLVDFIPKDRVYDWIHADPCVRGQQIIYICAQDLSDLSLFSNIIELFGDVPEVTSAAAARYCSGHWIGMLSVQFNERSAYLEEIAQQTQLNRFRNWALATSMELRESATAIQKQEEENRIGR